MEIKPAVILVACLLFGISNLASAEAACITSDITVHAVSYPDPGGRLVYYLTLMNTCDCAQKDVKLACPGFNSSVEVYPDTAIKPDGDGKLCSLYPGSPFGPKETIHFNYWYKGITFSFQPVSSTIAC